MLSFQVKSSLCPVSDNLPHLYKALKITDQFYRYGQLSNGIRMSEMTNMEICVSANLEIIHRIWIRCFISFTKLPWLGGFQEKIKEKK